MEIKRLDNDYAVAGQIGPEHVPAIAQAGFKTLICNRPDTENGAVLHDLVEEAAKQAGLHFRFLPVVSGQITEQNVADMAKALKEDSDFPL